MLDLPEVVNNKALAVGALEWIEGLEGLVRGLEHEWSIEVGAVLPGATEAFVAEAVLADGTPAVLKLVIPRSSQAAKEEITVLRIADGEGCVKLLRADEVRGALLVERLGPSLHDLALPIDQRHEILCAAAERVWRPAPECGLPSGADKGQWLSEFIVATWEALNRPCAQRVIDHALGCAERRISAHDDERAVLVHGDIHEWNALRADDGFKLIDPDGLLAEAEYDLGILMREDPTELLEGNAFDRASWLACRCHLDAVAIWEWGVVERVSTGLLCTQVDLQPIGREMLATAEHLAGLVDR